MAHKRQAPPPTVSEDKWHEGAMESARKKQKCKQWEGRHETEELKMTSAVTAKKKRGRMKQDPKKYFWQYEKLSKAEKKEKKENENVEQRGVISLECTEDMGPKPLHLTAMTPTYTPTYTPLYDPNASWQASTGVKLARDCPVTPGYDAPACGSAPRDEIPQNYLSPVYAELQRAFQQAMTPERILPDGDPAEWIDHWDICVAKKRYSYRDTQSRCAAKYSVGGRSPAAAKNPWYKDGDDSVVAEDAVKRSERIWKNREKKAIDFRIRCFLAMGKILDKISIESK